MNAKGELCNTNESIKKPWISEHTYSLIKEKHDMEQRRDVALGDQIKEVRRSKRERTGGNMHVIW